MVIRDYYYWFDLSIITLMFVLLFIDALFLYKTKDENDFDDEYLNIHRKYGYIKCEIAKLILAEISIYNLTAGTLNASLHWILALLYCIYVSKSIYYYVIYKRGRDG